MTEILERTETNNPTVAGAEFTTTCATLVEALATVAPAIAVRPSVPVLAGVLLESHGTDLWVRGFDYDTCVTVRIPDAVTGPGRALLLHGELTRLLKALAKGLGKRKADVLPVTIRNHHGQYATVELDGSTIPMELLPEDDYPHLPDAPPTFALTDTATFATEAHRVLSAVGGDDTLPILTGMKIDVGSDGLTLVATDRYRLTVGHVHAALQPDTVPRGGVLVDGHLLGKVLPKLQGTDLRLGFGTDRGGDLIALESGTVTVVTRQHADGEFVKYRELLPTTTQTTVVVERAALVTQIQRAEGVLSAKGLRMHPLTVTVDPHQGTVSVAPYLGQEATQARTRALPATITGSAGELGLNPRYLIDAVHSITGDHVVLHLQEPEKPVLLTATPDGLTDHTEFRHLIMPQRFVS